MKDFCLRFLKDKPPFLGYLSFSLFCLETLYDMQFYPTLLPCFVLVGGAEW